MLVRWACGPLGLNRPEFESPNGPFLKQRPTSETSSLNRICWVLVGEGGECKRTSLTGTHQEILTDSGGGHVKAERWAMAV